MNKEILTFHEYVRMRNYNPNTALLERQ